jgi:hypothetical protein
MIMYQQSRSKKNLPSKDLFKHLPTATIWVFDP